MSALVASDTRRPFSASSEISACSVGGPRPAATSNAPSSLRVKSDGVGFVIDSRTADVGGG